MLCTVKSILLMGLNVLIQTEDYGLKGKNFSQPTIHLPPTLMRIFHEDQMFNMAQGDILQWHFALS